MEVLISSVRDRNVTVFNQVLAKLTSARSINLSNTRQKGKGVGHPDRDHHRCHLHQTCLPFDSSHRLLPRGLISSSGSRLGYSSLRSSTARMNNLLSVILLNVTIRGGFWGGGGGCRSRNPVDIGWCYTEYGRFRMFFFWLRRGFSIGFAARKYEEDLLDGELIGDSFELPRGEPSRDADIELGQQPPVSVAEQGLEVFFKQVQVIEKQVDKLSTLSKNLQSANERSKTFTKASDMKAIKQQMQKDIDEAGKTARLAKSKFEELDRDNLANRQKPGCGKGSSIDRSRTATTEALKRKLKDRMSEFQAKKNKRCQHSTSMLSTGVAWHCGSFGFFPQTLRERIQQEYREVVERRVITVTGNRPNEETIDQLIETGNSEQIFQNAIQEQGRGQVMDTLAEIQERHNTVKDLERKLLELQQIFIDMAVLVDAQGEMLDNIETQVSSAVDHVQSGTVALQKAKTLQKNSRKWMCFAILILLLVVVIIVVTVIKPWSK
ncbi:hypothetical protein ZIOFF_004190 [Zingiber officinale]|uniref:t-SNARE coiled-coil homology domain-containing protein n=1 Tax=Zingiber officinale TaxID=94328 RepID=A0A8J5IAW7_ZINOF|nr:hypothetical protein ZIOFF_004190 [Zingiber officinale]